MKNLLRDILNPPDPLLQEAARVGDRDEVIQLGIEAAKMGLQVKDLGPMARSYHRLRFFSYSETDLEAIRHVLTAIREAQHG